MHIFRLSHETANLGLACTTEGLSLAGTPLLRRTPDGWTARSASEIGRLLKAAYGSTFDADLSSGLEVVARALNSGDVGRAMVASVLLKLPNLSWESAGRLIQVDEALAKYSPNEPRDRRGRWTRTGNGGVSSRPTRPKRRLTASRRAVTPHTASDRPLHPAALEGDGGAKFIPVSNVGAANDNMAVRVCLAASRQCQISALQDKSRTPYFAACQEAELACLTTLAASRLSPTRPFFVIFPDRTVVMIRNGGAAVNHVGGIRLPSPIR
jgi:hypothetical protein